MCIFIIVFENKHKVINKEYGRSALKDIHMPYMKDIEQRATP